MDSHNPYESPLGLEPLDEQRDLRAEYVVDRRLQSRMAMEMRNYWYRWSTLSILLTPVFYWLLTFAPAIYGQPTVARWLLSLLIPVVIIAVAEQIGWWINLQRLRKQTVLGALGAYVVVIDLSVVTIQTPMGTEQKSLRQTELTSHEKSAGMILDGNAALCIPATACFGDDSFKTWLSAAQSRWYSAKYGAA